MTGTIGNFWSMVVSWLFHRVQADRVAFSRRVAQAADG
jgi:hypothetical protein